MPLGKNKKMIQVAVNIIYYKKLQYLKDKFKRSTDSDLVRYLLEKYIDDFERINGVIQIDSKT